jgi:hypothetical protein
MLGNITSKVEDAWHNYFVSSSLTGSISGSNIIRGKSFLLSKGEESNPTDPILVCSCTDSQEVLPGMGIYRTAAILTLSIPFSGSVNGEMGDANNQLIHNFNSVCFGNNNLIASLTGSTNNFYIENDGLSLGSQSDMYDGDTYVLTTLINMVAKQI